jgi:opacity protein-like surface antigen
VVGVVVAAGLLAGGPAGAAERLHAGLMDLSLVGGYSLSHDRKDVDRVDGFHLLPHFGYLLSPYFELLAEPTLVHFRSDDASATGVGLWLLGRLLIDTGTRVAPYLEAGGGILGGQLEFRQTNCDVNFSFAGGLGVLVFVAERTAVTAGYRFQHLSNGDRCDQNLGLNSSLFTVGVSHFFE